MYRDDHPHKEHGMWAQGLLLLVGSDSDSGIGKQGNRQQVPADYIRFWNRREIEALTKDT
jgi:hypothetical protein